MSTDQDLVRCSLVFTSTTAGSLTGQGFRWVTEQNRLLDYSSPKYKTIVPGIKYSMMI